MLLKINRLKKRKQFNYVFKHGDHQSNKLLTLVYFKTKSKGYKIGFSVSKKVGNAVVRNKTKRRMREIVRNLQIINGYLCILVAKPEMATATFEQIKQSVLYAFEKAKLLEQSL